MLKTGNYIEINCYQNTYIKTFPGNLNWRWRTLKKGTVTDILISVLSCEHSKLHTNITSKKSNASHVTVFAMDHFTVEQENNLLAIEMTLWLEVIVMSWLLFIPKLDFLQSSHILSQSLYNNKPMLLEIESLKKST